MDKKKKSVKRYKPFNSRAKKKKAFLTVFTSRAGRSRRNLDREKKYKAFKNI
jgi:hypothetical protein